MCSPFLGIFDCYTGMERNQTFCTLPNFSKYFFTLWWVDDSGIFPTNTVLSKFSGSYSFYLFLSSSSAYYTSSAGFYCFCFFSFFFIFLVFYCASAFTFYLLYFLSFLFLTYLFLACLELIGSSLSDSSLLSSSEIYYYRYLGWALFDLGVELGAGLGALYCWVKMAAMVSFLWVSSLV